MRIEGSTALVAGGASGLGAATVRRLHAAGAQVVIADLQEERGRALAEELGDRARFMPADVTSDEQVQAAVAAAAETPGGLRIAITCAGVAWAENTTAPPSHHPPELFATVITTNPLVPFH